MWVGMSVTQRSCATPSVVIIPTFCHSTYEVTNHLAGHEGSSKLIIKKWGLRGTCRVIRWLIIFPFSTSYTMSYKTCIVVNSISTACSRPASFVWYTVPSVCCNWCWKCELCEERSSQKISRVKWFLVHCGCRRETLMVCSTVLAGMNQEQHIYVRRKYLVTERAGRKIHQRMKCVIDV